MIHCNEFAPILLAGRDDEPDRIEGYAAVFYDGSPATEFRRHEKLKPERIGSRAFARSLGQADADILATFNHDKASILGRTASGTLKVEADDRGLRYSVQVGTRIGRDVAELVQRGDVRGSSFTFVPRKITRSRQAIVVEDLDLLEVGPVVSPAYSGTNAELRAFLRLSYLGKLVDHRAAAVTIFNGF